jgi:hypothetical protein
LPSHYIGADLSTVERTGVLLEGKELCVMTGTDNHDKKKLEVLAHTHGASVVQNPSAKTLCIIAGKKSK